MLVDINAYVGHWPFLQLQYNTCKGMLERMDRFGVDLSVISNLNGIFYKNTQAANEELHEELRSDRRFADRFIPFAVINPTYAGWRDDLSKCMDTMGMRGVRLYPQYHDYALTDPSCIELVQRMRDRRLPVAFTLRMVDFRQRSWMDIDKEWAVKDILPIITTVPDAVFMILNVANGASLSDADTDTLRKTNLLMDSSGRALSDLPALLARYGAEKFAFGTHAPVLDYATGLLRIEALTDAEVDQQTKERLRSGNAKRVLNL